MRNGGDAGNTASETKLPAIHGLARYEGDKSATMNPVKARHRSLALNKMNPNSSSSKPRLMANSRTTKARDSNALI